MELFRHVDGCCPFCNGVVNVIEGMVFDYGCNPNGVPEELFSEHYKLAGYCMHCNSQVYPRPNGIGGYNMYPVPIQDTITRYESIGVADKVDRISVIGSKILDSTSTEVNPFINVIEHNKKQPDCVIVNDSGIIAFDIPTDDDCPF